MIHHSIMNPWYVIRKGDINEGHAPTGVGVVLFIRTFCGEGEGLDIKSLQNVLNRPRFEDVTRVFLDFYIRKINE